MYTHGSEKTRDYLPFPNTHPTKEPVYESAILEEPMNSMISDMSNLTDIPEEVLFQNYLHALCMWTHMNDASWEV